MILRCVLSILPFPSCSPRSTSVDLLSNSLSCSTTQPQPQPPPSLPTQQNDPSPRSLAPLDLHFIHQRANRDRPAAPPPLPLLLLHGWPGSVVEFLAVVGPLSDPGPDHPTAQAFDVVAPSLPGFGFSEAPKEQGWGLRAMASCFNALMTTVLKYERYCVQGGDWGSLIARRMALDFGCVPAPPSALDKVKSFFSAEKLGGGRRKERQQGLLRAASASASSASASSPPEEEENPNPRPIVAVHQNMAIASPRLSSPWTLLQLLNAPFAHVAPIFITKDEAKGLKGLLIYQTKESGYFKIQSTKPMTLGYGLSDSPVAALAWVSVRSLEREVWGLGVVSLESSVVGSRARAREREGENGRAPLTPPLLLFSPPPSLSPPLSLQPVPTNGKKIQEKFHGWGDLGADRTKNPDDASAPHHFRRGDLLLNACLYWFGNRACSSVRIYKEVESAGEVKELLAG